MRTISVARHLYVWNTMTNNTEPRRRFLQQIVAVVPATTLAGSAGVVAATAAVPAAAAPAAKPYSPLFFNDAEWKFLQAAVDRLIPADDNGPGAIEACVPEFIDRQMNTPYASGALWFMQGPFNADAAPEMGWQSKLVPKVIYRLGIAATDAWSKAFNGKAFAAQDSATRDDMLRRLEAGGSEVAAHFDAVPPKIFFNLLLQNTKEGFFCDPIHGGNKGIAHRAFGA